MIQHQIKDLQEKHMEEEKQRAIVDKQVHT